MRELALELDDRLGRRDGLEQALRNAIRSGRLASGSALPSTRVLAVDLGCSRSTVVTVYEQLSAEGYLESCQGRGTVVTGVHSLPAAQSAPLPTRSRFRSDFRPGEPDASSFPRAKWLRSVRRVLAESSDEAFGYPDPRGVVQLRSELAEYLARSRSVEVSADAVSIFAGFTAAVAFVAEVFRARGITEVALENPTLFIMADLLRVAGLQSVPIPLDEEGIRVDALEASGVRAVVVTPAHQYPMGYTMSPTRRGALISWAEGCDGWVVEDDYDGEFRYDRRPLGALQGLAPDRVIYAGTTSKSLAPGLRLGWLIAPRELRSDLAEIKHLRGATSVIDQLVLADFIRHGELDRHLRAQRKLYGQRQSLLVEILAKMVPALHLDMAAAGLHLACRLPDCVDERALIQQAAEEGLGLGGFSSHWNGKPDGPGLILGYSRPAAHEYPKAVEHLGRFLAARLA